MSNENILIKVLPHETKVALVCNGQIKEYYVERHLNKGIVGNIYIGKIVRVLPGMQCAFIDLGIEKTGFLHVADFIEAKQDNASSILPIEKILAGGQFILVQVIKDAMGTKGPRLTTHISIAGRNLVYLPTEKDHIGISQKITDNIDREQLRKKLEQIITPNLKGGFILRTASNDAEAQDFAQDMQYLLSVWQKIIAIPKTRIELVHTELPISFKICRDTKNIDAIYIDNTHHLEVLKEFLTIYIPQMRNIVHLHQNNRDILDLYNIEQILATNLERRVNLKSGGFLVIDETEAMITIDVNTGGYIGKTSFADTILKINLEACDEIAYHLRLRNLGGIIIIDFIDMHNEDHHCMVIDQLKKSLSTDRAKTCVYGFTNLGLVEMTRKRTRESLSHLFYNTCAHCQGSGKIKNIQTICYEILSQILRQANQFTAQSFRIVAHPDVIQRFLQEERVYLEEVRQIIQKEIHLQSQSFSNSSMYDIILM
jgi:ribonuclease G